MKILCKIFTFHYVSLSTGNGDDGAVALAEICLKCNNVGEEGLSASVLNGTNNV